MKRSIIMTALAMSCSFACNTNSSTVIEPDAIVTPDVDGTGNWNMTYDFTADNCGNPGTSGPLEIVVASTGSDLFLQLTGTTVTAGSMLCSPFMCELTATFTWTVSSGSAHADHTLVNDLTLNPIGMITGNGQETIKLAAQTCTSDFTATGLRN